MALTLLTGALGDLSNYRFSGWIYDHVMDNWETQWKCMDGEPPAANIPEATDYCHCGQKIRYHYLIEHIQTKKRHFVGSVCYGHFATLHKSCPTCYDYHHAVLSHHCKTCRIKCKVCEKYHSSNINHNFIMIKFGKCKGQSIAAVIKDDPKYILWLGQQEWVDDATIERIQMLMDRIILPFGKYKGLTINQLRNEDHGYLDYILKDSRLH